MLQHDDYSNVAYDEVEWYSRRRGCTHPYALLIRVEKLQETIENESLNERLIDNSDIDEISHCCRCVIV